MRNFTKIVLSLVMAFGLLGGVNSVKATKTSWSPSSPWSGAKCKWTDATSSFSWDGTNGTVRAIETGFSGDLSGYTKFHATVSNLTGAGVTGLQLKVNCTGGSEKLIDLTSGENLIDMATWFADPSSVTTFELWGPTSSDTDCSAVVTDVYLEKPDAPFSVTSSGFGDEITGISYITTEGKSFVISDNGTKALYFYNDGGDNPQNSKNADVTSIPNTAYFTCTLEKVDDSGLAGDNIYRIRIKNLSGTDYSGVSSGYYLNTPNTGWSISFAGVSDKLGSHVYGQDADYKGLWYVTYEVGNGFTFQNVGKATDGNGWPSWLTVGDLSSSKAYVKLYKSINFTTTTTYPANDDLFAVENFVGGKWDFASPVDLSNWNYLVIATEVDAADGDHMITIKDNTGKTISGDDYVDDGTGAGLYLSRWHRENIISIDLNKLKNTYELDITQISSVEISGSVAISVAYLTCYNNTKISAGDRWDTYTGGDVVREYTAIDKFGTICLPYKASWAGAEIYEIVDKSGSSVSLSKVTGLLEAGKPYFYMSSDVNGKNNEGAEPRVRNVNFFRADFDEYDSANPITNNGLIGTFSDIDAPQGANYYVLSNNKLYNVDSKVTVGANKAYINKSAIVNIPVSARVLELDFNEPTGIETVANSQELNANSKFFNLAGQRVAQPTKGLYIVNGKKVLVK